MTVPAVASALAGWMAQCRSWEDREIGYERATGNRWAPELLEVFFGEFQENPDAAQFAAMVRQLGREEAARGLRRQMELFHERYLSEPEAEVPAHPVLVVDNTRRSPRRAKLADGDRRREGAGSGPPGNAA